MTGARGRIVWDFNPRSPDGERRLERADGRVPERISIHAPRMGSDHTAIPLCR